MISLGDHDSELRFYYVGKVGLSERQQLAAVQASEVQENLLSGKPASRSPSFPLPHHSGGMNKGLTIMLCSADIS